MHVESPSQTDGRGLKLPYGFSVVAVSMAAAVGWLAGSPGLCLWGCSRSFCPNTLFSQTKRRCQVDD